MSECISLFFLIKIFSFGGKLKRKKRKQKQEPYLIISSILSSHLVTSTRSTERKNECGGPQSIIVKRHSHDKARGFDHQVLLSLSLLLRNETWTQLGDGLQWEIDWAGPSVTRLDDFRKFLVTIFLKNFSQNVWFWAKVTNITDVMTSFWATFGQIWATFSTSGLTGWPQTN